MLYRPWTVLTCLIKNLLMAMGIGDAARSVKRMICGEVNWATMPLDSVYAHVVGIHRDLMRHAGMSQSDLAGMVALEVGPGTNLGVALLFLVHGCRKAIVLEKSRAIRHNAMTDALYRRIVEERGADMESFFGTKGRSPKRILCFQGTTFDSLAQIVEGGVDLIYSHRVLEHVHDVAACFRHMFRLLRPGGQAMHIVDLAGHGEFEGCGEPLDMLRYPPHLWRAMFSQREGVNRLRFGAYLDLIEQAGLEVVAVKVLGRLDSGELDRIRPYLWREFSGLPDDELGVTSFFVLARKP